MNNIIKVKIKYKMNFSPRLLNSNNISAKWKLEKLHCRNFIFTILAFDLIKSKFVNKFKFKDFSIIITKKRKHYGSTLRAPYKCKIAQFSLGIYRYYMSLNFCINTTNVVNLNSFNDFFLFNKNMTNNYNYFESSLVTQVSRSFNIPANITLLNF